MFCFHRAASKTFSKVLHASRWNFKPRHTTIERMEPPPIKNDGTASHKYYITRSMPRFFFLSFLTIVQKKSGSYNKRKLHLRGKKRQNESCKTKEKRRKKTVHLSCQNIFELSFCPLVVFNARTAV